MYPQMLHWIDKPSKVVEGILFIDQRNHIGQVKVEQAQAEIDRLQNQEIGSVWVKDFTPLLKEREDLKVTELCPGYCWVVKQY